MSEKERMSGKDMVSHMRILEENMNKDRFEGVNLTGEFEEPALVLVLESMPGKATFNILKNTVKFSDDNSTFLYIHAKGKTYKLGRIREGIDEVYVMNELFERFGVSLVKVDSGGRYEVYVDDYITRMEL